MHSLQLMCYWLIAVETSGGADLNLSPECYAAGSAFDAQLPCNCLQTPRSTRDGAVSRALLISIGTGPE